jgi:hypothetical protein
MPYRVAGTGQPVHTPDPFKLLLLRYKGIVAVALILLGIALRYVVGRYPNFFIGGFGDMTKDFGALLVGTVAVTFIYEVFIKSDEHALFLAELKEAIRQERYNRFVRVYPERPPIEEKLRVISSAQKEVIELGTSLRTFVSYFDQTADDLFSNHIVELLKRGVNIQCLLLDPARAPATHPHEPAMQQRIEASLAALDRIRAGFKARPDLKGSFSISLYDHAPTFAAICVDGASEDGQIFVTPYLMGIKNANAPAYLISRREHPTVHAAYYTSLQNDIKAAIPYVPPRAAPAASSSASSAI